MHNVVYECKVATELSAPSMRSEANWHAYMSKLELLYRELTPVQTSSARLDRRVVQGPRSTLCRCACAKFYLRTMWAASASPRSTIAHVMRLVVARRCLVHDHRVFHDESSYYNSYHDASVAPC
ncbi:hypothetical protein GOBAR_AA14950 [Gossypium barbadense]|uniref:Uncharacterized protein n=1 Tax=Gossypium barbadense TaxID=3634 RepID=A0A2P5XQT0_GOSBA|nr:hypothetical protein GOBAR_AA14950 [Gossypium barbadense]